MLVKRKGGGTRGIPNRHKVTPERAAADVWEPKHARHQAGCSCSSCARWSRIYEEKFADPTYYQRGAIPRTVSPLSEL